MGFKKPQGKPRSKSDKFASYFTDKKGVRHYARDYGHKAWPIRKSG